MSKHGMETPVHPQGLVAQRSPRFLSLHRVSPTTPRYPGVGEGPWDLWPQNWGPQQPLMTQRGVGVEESHGEGEKNICVHIHTFPVQNKKSSTISKRSLFLQNSSQTEKIRICINSFIFIQTERDFRQLCMETALLIPISEELFT